MVLLRRPFVLLRIQGAGVRDGRRPRHRALGHRARRARRAPRASSADGYLEIDLRRTPTDDPEWVDLHVEVEVANYYPAIASTFTQWVYAVTQSRIHVLVTYGFLRSLAKLDLEESQDRPLRGASTEVPDPSGPRPSQRSAGREASRVPSATG